MLDKLPYSGYFSRGNIFVKVVILAISWKKFRGHAVCLLFGRVHAVFFVGKYFVVHLSTTKTTKILPPEKYPLYGMSIITSYIIHLYSFTPTQLPRAVSYITVAHEIGHNYGSPVSKKV